MTSKNELLRQLMAVLFFVAKMLRMFIMLSRIIYSKDTIQDLNSKFQLRLYIVVVDLGQRISRESHLQNG